MDIRSGTALEGPNGQLITIESLIGRGGFGQVFAGRLADDTRVAVKTVLTAALDEAELRTFQNEARLAVGITHPNVVRVLYVNDGEAAQGRPPYLVMEYVEGGTLGTRIAAQRAAGTPMPVPELRTVFRQVAVGMAAVNARVVHRDLKPDNVLVDQVAGLLKIADFGLAKLADAATRSATFKGWGTRPYQAPEAFEDGPNTPAMDIYAAGVMFYQLATLTWPVEPKAGDHGPLAWRNAHLLTAPRDIRALRADLPIDLVQLIMQMLEKNPAKRPASFTAVHERLEKGAAAPVAGRPDVSGLLSKATTSFVQETEQAAAARRERERVAERRALLVQAFAEPVAVLREIVETFSASSDVAKLTIREQELEVTVTGRPGRPRLEVSATIGEDIDTRYDGIVRMAATVHLDPTPEPTSEREALYDRESFGSFDLVYRVRRAEERFGTWTQFRFERSPLAREREYPRWHAAPDLLDELHALRAIGVHQHEQRPLDGEWFMALLAQMV